MRVMGSRKSISDKDFRRYIVSLKGANSSARLRVGRPTRQQVYAARLARTNAFRSRLQDWIDSNSLSSEVRSLETAGALPLLLLDCTPSFAQLLRAFPGVRFVVLDEQPDVDESQPLQKRRVKTFAVKSRDSVTKIPRPVRRGSR